MHRFLKNTIVWVTTFTLFFHAGIMNACAKPDWPADTGVLAEAGIVMDMDSKTVLFGQNIHLPYPPASITKLLTALVVVENARLDETVTFSHDAIYNVEAGSSNTLHFEEGDQLSVEHCLYAMLLISSNPAANALAEHVGKSRSGFVDMMNEKLKELGCEESHFANPSGLNDDNQYVSAYDMALIAAAAFENEQVLAISSSINHSIPATLNNPEGASFQMEHKLVRTTSTGSQYYLEGATAGKTGYTRKAGNTLVTYAVRDGKNLVSVILKGTQPQYYMDAKEIMNFGFSSFQNLPVAGSETFLQENQQVEANGTSYPVSDLSYDDNAVISLPVGAVFSDAERTLVTELPAGHPQDAAAMLQYTYNGRAVGTAWLHSKSLHSSQDLTVQPVPNEDITKPEREKKEHGNLGRILLTAVGILAAVALLAGGFLLFREKQRREREALARRRARRRQRLLESGVSEEEFNRLRQERFHSDGTRTRKKR